MLSIYFVTIIGCKLFNDNSVLKLFAVLSTEIGLRFILLHRMSHSYNAVVAKLVTGIIFLTEGFRMQKY